MVKPLFALLIIFARLSLAQGAELSWEDCVREAAENNPSIRAAHRNLDAAVFDERAAYRGFFPEVNGALTYGRSGADSGGVALTQDAYGAQITASQNVFNGLADAGRVAQAKAAAERSRAALDATKASLSYDLKAAFAGMLYAQSYRSLAEQIVKRREDNLSLVGLRFDNGSENKGSVLLSKANLEQAKLEALQARNALDTARTELARVLGRDEFEPLKLNGTVPTAPPTRNFDLRALASQTPTQKQALANEKSADAGVTVARAGFFPSLNLTGSTGRGGPEFFPRDSRWSVGVALNVPLFSGGSTYYGTKSALRLNEAATLNRENTYRAETQKLNQAFAAFEQTAQRLEVDKAFAEASQVRATIGRQRYNNGLLTFENWDVIESDLINRQKSLIQSQRDRVTSEAAWEAAQGKGVFQ
ncbi:MAG: TolC family protein [Proteobacteria bacterium]|nr:MAG: TolC family protein [Pseudomonadota bacterium]